MYTLFLGAMLLSKKILIIGLGIMVALVIGYLLSINQTFPPDKDAYDELVIYDAMLSVERKSDSIVNITLFIAVKNFCDKEAYLERVYVDDILVKDYGAYSVRIDPGKSFEDTIWVGVFDSSDKTWAIDSLHWIKITYRVDDKEYMFKTKIRCVPSYGGK